jgi:hypothetical protein
LRLNKTKVGGAQRRGRGRAQSSGRAPPPPPRLSPSHRRREGAKGSGRREASVEALLLPSGCAGERKRHCLREGKTRRLGSGSGSSEHIAGSTPARVSLEVVAAASVRTMLPGRFGGSLMLTFCLGIWCSVAEEVPFSEMEDLLGSEIGKNDYDWCVHTRLLPLLSPP